MPSPRSSNRLFLQGANLLSGRTCPQSLGPTCQKINCFVGEKFPNTSRDQQMKMLSLPGLFKTCLYKFWCDSCNILETGRSFHGQASPGYTFYQFIGSDYSKEKQNRKALETVSRTSPQTVSPGPAASHPWRVDWKCRVLGPALICWICICWIRSGVCTALLWPGSADSARTGEFGLIWFLRHPGEKSSPTCRSHSLSGIRVYRRQ